MMNTKRINYPQSKIALLVIDVQQGLFERPTPLYQAEALVKNINLLIDKARRANGGSVFW